jgi:hypothetical protein
VTAALADVEGAIVFAGPDLHRAPTERIVHLR